MIQYNTILVIPKISLLCDTPVLLAYKSTNFHNTPISSSFLFCIVKYAKWMLKKITSYRDLSLTTCQTINIRHVPF